MNSKKKSICYGNYCSPNWLHPLTINMIRTFGELASNHSFRFELIFLHNKSY